MKNIEKLFEKAVVSKIKTNHIGAKLVYNENGYGILTYISNLDGALNMDFKESKKNGKRFKIYCWWVWRIK